MVIGYRVQVNFHGSDYPHFQLYFLEFDHHQLYSYSHHFDYQRFIFVMLDQIPHHHL